MALQTCAPIPSSRRWPPAFKFLSAFYQGQSAHGPYLFLSWQTTYVASTICEAVMAIQYFLSCIVVHTIEHLSGELSFLPNVNGAGSKRYMLQTLHLSLATITDRRAHIVKGLAPTSSYVIFWVGRASNICTTLSLVGLFTSSIFLTTTARNTFWTVMQNKVYAMCPRFNNADSTLGRTLMCLRTSRLYTEFVGFEIQRLL